MYCAIMVLQFCLFPSTLCQKWHKTGAMPREAVACVVGTLFSQQEWNENLINENSNNSIDHTYEKIHMDKDKAKKL